MVLLSAMDNTNIMVCSDSIDHVYIDIIVLGQLQTLTNNYICMVSAMCGIMLIVHWEYMLLDIVFKFVIYHPTTTSTKSSDFRYFCAKRCKKVVGIEYVPEAIEDAKINAELNGHTNMLFYAGDMKDVLTRDFIDAHGRPDVIITDPPRAGMHTDVIDTILFAAPERIVYVSCNPATQARDLALMSGMYRIVSVQPVDMFPHTHHVENVVKLEKR